MEPLAVAEHLDELEHGIDATFSDYNLELMQAADTLVSGATTYRGFVSYWPAVADDPAQPEVERAISRRHRELEHLVVSDSLTGEETGPWRENTTIVRKDEARDTIAQAKAGEGGALVALGSVTTWNDLLAAGLVDELHMMVVGTDDEWRGWWGPNPPFHTPVFILTHHQRPSIEMKGGTVFHFVDASPQEALDLARQAAGDLDVRVGGGPTVVRDFLAVDLIDTLHVVQVPILDASIAMPDTGARKVR